MNEEYISRIIAERDPVYRSCADLIIATDNKDIEAICKEITFKLLSYN